MTGQEGDRSQSNLGSVGSRHSRPLGGFKPVPRGERRTGRHGSMLSRQRSRLRVWHESREWCSTRNGSRSTKWECDRRQIRNRAKVVVPTDARLDSGHRAIVVRCEKRSRWLARQPGENGSRQRPISNQSVVSRRVRVELGREAVRGQQSKALPGQPCSPKWSSCPTCNYGSGSKNERRKRQVGRTESTASLEAAVFTPGVRARQVHRSVHIWRRGAASPGLGRRLPENVSWSPRFTGRPLREPPPPANALQRVWQALNRDWSRALGGAVDLSRPPG